MSTKRTFGAFPTGKKPEDKMFNIQLPSIPKEFKLEKLPYVMNQGSSPICAAISIGSIMEWQDMAKTGDNRGKTYDAFQIYKLREDPAMEGMVPRDALTKVKSIGVNGDQIKGFYFVDSVELAKASIMTNGPMMLCTRAYDHDEFWKPSGAMLGGHATILVGWEDDGFILQNSWGTSYANAGRIKFPFEDWKFVLEGWTIEI